ncbi:uncharacterized protein LOC126766087 isoform X2 [Bactrocera neohumeralis]|uniref:uncharacterized protein LOC126766087 isoform X2 n=1 Tax=Bactrocera neohumeralis TaxID=98809 RepID=UPI002166ADB5|nr:uncharacterized protein LOC126766087 isoform X2 [Bactrocera neohumeralis]
MSSILQQQLTFEKLIKAPVHTCGAVFPTPSTLSPILHNEPDTNKTTTKSQSAVDSLERFCADPMAMAAHTLLAASTDYVMPATDSIKNNNNDKVSNSNINVLNQQNKCSVSNNVDQVIPACETLNSYPSVHVLPISVDMHSSHDDSLKLAASPVQSKSFSEDIADIDHMYACDRDRTTKQLVDEKLRSSSGLSGSPGHEANTHQLLTNHTRSYFEHEFKQQVAPVVLIPQDHHPQHQQKYSQTQETQANNEVINGKGIDITNKEHQTVNSKHKGGRDSSFNITAFSNSSGACANGGLCGTSEETNVVEADTRRNIPVLDVLLNDEQSKNMFKHLSPPKMGLAQASTHVLAVQRNIGPNAVAVGRDNFPPPNDCMIPVDSSTFLYEKESQLLTKLFATDLVIPKCYIPTSAVNSFHVDAEDIGGPNKSGNRSQHGNDMLDNAKEKRDVDLSMQSARSTLPSTEATKQLNVPPAPLNLLTEILLLQQHYQHKQQSQLLTSAANNVNIATALQKDQLHMNKLSTASPLSAPLTLPFPFQLPLPLSLSLPLLQPLPLSMPPIPILENTKNNNGSNSISKQYNFEVPAFLTGDSTDKCKDQIYLKSKHEPATHREHQQKSTVSSQQQQEASNHFLTTQFLYSRMLPALADNLRGRDLHMIDCAPSISMLNTLASSTLPSENDSNNNRNNLPNDNSENVDTNSAFDTVTLSPKQSNTQYTSTPNLSTDISRTDRFSSIMTNRNATTTNLSGTELLSAQEAALTQAQIQLDKYLGLSNQFIELTQNNLTISDKLTAHIVPRVWENLQQSKQLIHSTQTQLSLLRRQCASAKFYYERTMRRLYSSDSKYLSQLQAHKKPSAYSSSWCPNNIVTRAAVIAAMAAASELQPLPTNTFVKTESSISGKSEITDKECERALDKSQTLLEIETVIERYVKTVCKNNEDADAVTNEISGSDFMPRSNDNYDNTRTPVYSSPGIANNDDGEYEFECNANVKRRNKTSSPFTVGSNANWRLLEASSPICFWHPDNRGLSVNEGVLSASEIILECAALSVQAHMQDPSIVVNRIAGERTSTPSHECERGGITENSEHTTTDGETFQGLLLKRVLNTRSGSYNGDHDTEVIKNANNEKKELQQSPSGSPMAVNATNSPNMLTPTSTPTTTPTPPNINAAIVGKNHRKSNYAHHLEPSISPASTITNLTHKKALFYEQSNSQTLRQRYSSNNNGDIANNNTNDNMDNKIEPNKKLETLQVIQATSESPVSPSVAVNIGHNKKNQQHQQQQQQAAFSGCSSSSTGGSGSGCLYGLNGPSSNTNSETTTAAVAALQECAFTNIFKARFNALTAAAVMNATVGISAAAAAASVIDGPYDLSISRKAKQTNLDSKISTANPQGNECKDNSNEKKKPHIKKPLNAFMLYMKEMRAKVVAECTLKESAAINQILGRRWHALGRDEQAKYYELARRERQLHMQMYPDWSSRTNTSRGKKRKRKQDTNDGGGGGNNMKKCRARFGLDQQNQWCKPCRRKKKCIRYMEGLRGSAGISGTKDDSFQDLDDLDDNASDENLGSPGSIDDNNKTPDDDTGSLNHSLSSPGCQSGLSSLQSPSTSMASPLNLLPSPATPSTIGLPFGLTDNQQDQNVQSQQQLQQPNSGIDSAAQQIRMQQSSQHQIHLSQHQHLLQQHQPHPHTTSSHNGIYEHAGRSFICSGSIGVGRSTIISPSLSNKSSSGICIGSSNTLINTSSSASGVTTTAAFTERTMRSLLNPSPSGLLLNNNCFPPSGLESSAGAIISIEHILSNANKISSGTASNTTTTNTVGNRANDDLNGFISFNNNSDPSFTNNTGNNSACENNSMAVTSTPLVSDTVKPLPAAVAKSSVSSSAPSSPVGDTFEKAVAPAQRNPIGANPHDINNPLSINQLTKCSESTSNTNKNIVTTTNNNFKNIFATADKNSNSSCFDNISTASSSNTNGIAAKKYNHNNQQLPKQLALRISSTASSPQQQQLATTCLFPPVPQHYQQQFHLHTSTGQPTPPTHHHASHRHSHAHPPLFNQHFQQFSHHLASVAAAAAATNVHIPNILSAAVVKPNNSMQRNTTSNVIANEAAAPTIIEAIETIAEDKACTESVGNLTALKCHASETTVATTTSMPGTTTVTTKTLPVLAADNTPLLNVNTTASGNENGAISVT